MSESAELESLRNTRTNLEEQSRNLESQQKNLEERVKILEERIAIQGLNEGNNVKQKAIDQLEVKVSELEKMLNATEEIHTTTGEATEVEAQNDNPEVVNEETSEGEAEIVAAEPSIEGSRYDRTEDEFKQHQEKKKRRLF